MTLYEVEREPLKRFQLQQRLMLFSLGNKKEVPSSVRSEVAKQPSRRNRFKTCVNINVACKEICLGFLTLDNCLKISGS